jgi:hypothetical protein
MSKSCEDLILIRMVKDSFLMEKKQCNFIQINKKNSPKVSIPYPEQLYRDMAILYFEEKKQQIL